MLELFKVADEEGLKLNDGAMSIPNVAAVETGGETAEDD